MKWPHFILLVFGFFAALAGTLFSGVRSSNLATAAAIIERPLPVLTGEQRLAMLIEDYDRFFSESMALHQTPGAAVVIVKDGEVVFQRGYGVKVANTSDSVDVNTVFRVGSLSKGFAGVLSGILVQEGTLAWNEPVQKHFPAFTLSDRAQARRMQLRHLLSHTTGLPHHAFTHLIERGLSTTSIVRYHFPKTRLYGREGERFNYQNVAFSAIGEVMEDATGKTYSELLAEKIFRPAGMQYASSDFATIGKCLNKALPHLHKKGLPGWQPEMINERYYNSAPAGGVNASITDMGEWLKVLLGHRPDIVADTTLDRVFTPVISTDKGRPIFPLWIGREDAYYAYGWRVLHHGSDVIVYHGGYVNGFRGEIAFNRKDGIGICVLFNASDELGMSCIPAFFERWDAKRAGILGWRT